MRVLMKRHQLPLCFLFFCLTFLSGAVAAEVPKFDRSIAKTPKYTGTPKYLMLLFGPESKTRICCVLDGNHLYVDRNGNGDLTEEGERVTTEDHNFEVGEITEVDGKTTHRNLQISKPFPAGDDDPEYLWINVDVKGEYGMYSICYVDDSMKSPESAPFRHFNGPMTFQISDQDNAKLVRGDKPEELYIMVGTYYRLDDPKPTNRIYALLNYANVPDDVHPLVEVSFPGKGPNDKLVQLKLPLKQRC